MKAIPRYLTELRNTAQAAIDDPAFCLAIDGMVGVIATAAMTARAPVSAGSTALPGGRLLHESEGKADRMTGRQGGDSIPVEER
jgi:hypothetical protein